jgi:citrate lyase subunit beta/citryl-CoA lyase
MDKNKYLLRTMMFVPGHNDKLQMKAANTDADALILDLEDSCKPDSIKEVARTIIKEKVSSGIFKNFKVFVRINPRRTGFLFKDVSELTIEGIDGFLYPMAKSERDIIFFSNLLTEIELSKGLEPGLFTIVPVIETAGGVLNARQICAASKRVVAIGFGSEDFTTDLQSIRDDEGKSIFSPRAMIAFAARAENVIPIDTPHIKVHDINSLEEHCLAAKTLGFGGMQILHPKEIETVHRIYSPSSEEIEEAKEMIKLSVEAEKENRGVIIMNEKFVGPPLVKRAKKIIENSELIENLRKRR